MRVVPVIRRWRTISMHFDPSRQSSSISSSGTPLKRPFAHQAHAVDRSSNTSSQPQTLQPPDSSITSPHRRPLKVPRLDSIDSSSGHQTSSFMSRTNHSRHTGSIPEWRSGRASAHISPSSRGRDSGRGKKKSGPNQPVISGPLHDTQYIKSTYMTVPLKPEWEVNPKAPVSNYCTQVNGKNPVYDSMPLLSPNGQVIWRSTLSVQHEDGDIVAHGDNASKKESEKLAALSALCQMTARGLMDNKKAKAEKAQASYAPTEVTLSDGTVVGFERARQFMDYYCRRFGFGWPDVAYNEMTGKGAAGWEAVMTVGDSKIGLGSGPNKKAAMTTCYVDVAQYLESCDPDLWTKFVEDAKTGRDLGMAREVLFTASETVEDRIRDLCQDIKNSDLYRNRPKIGSLLAGPGYMEGLGAQKGTVPKYIAPNRRKATEDFLADKSKRLQQRRKDYLEDPSKEKMRDTRASLPVYTKAEDLLAHIREHDVTICMAATGSGKTTQIPQLILDDWIDRGEGAKCNVVCTQPRRIAAISVANRVASERGQTAGNGSVGYQVRFEAKLPEEHGSITFCTTGIFLKRMQSALQDGANTRHSLDDVTHILVDEVHERDVDTDLLLVVLKRLLADRKARGKPIKVILMSATIDPKLFQEYFPDERGVPASVTEIPGRSFPVEKHYLDDFIPQLVSTADPRSHWVFQENSVQKYLIQELGPDLPNIPGLPLSLMSASKKPDGDLELPYPLIALTIAHVLRNSSDGHVLVFLPGWDDITGVQKCLQSSRQTLGLNFNDTEKYSIHCLHSTIPVAEQQVIFDPPPEGQRRIILSTNIAETSVTIPDVVYVVDSAKIKEQRYDPERHISSLVSAWVGSSNLNQRAGRAGRHRPGEYYGVLGRHRAETLHPYQTVEMKRVDLSNIVMHVKALNFPSMAVEEVLAATIEPPAPERVEAAMKSLQMVGALDSDKRLTSLGRVLLQLPVDPQMGRLVLFGSFFRCLDQALTLAAILTNRDPFMSPMHLKVEAAARKNSFSPDEFRSDALATLRAYNMWWAMQSRGEYSAANRFCMDNFLSKPTLVMIEKIKGHLLRSLYDVGVIDVSAGGAVAGNAQRGPRSELQVPSQLNENGESLPLLAALVTIASQPKFAIYTQDKKLRTAQDKMTFIHPSSVNNRKRLDPEQENATQTEKHIIAYAEKRQNISAAGANASTAQKFLVNTTRLDPLIYMLFGAYHLEVTRRGLVCDEWLPIVGRVDALDDVERLKFLMEACMLRVYEGITISQVKKRARGGPVPRRELKEDESEDEGDGDEDSPLSSKEVQELDLMTHDITCILNDYTTYRVANQSRHNSRPGTPIDSPLWGASRLPSMGSRSGYSTPHPGGISSTFYSRPSTPSRLSRS